MSDRRRLPSVDSLLQDPRSQPLFAHFGRALVTATYRQIVSEVRADVGQHESHAAPDPDYLVAEAYLRLHPLAFSAAPHVINATGVLLHTNLGRAPLPPRAIKAITDELNGYSALEFDLNTGKRGHRGGEAESLLIRLTNAPAACVVNNNASAALLILSALFKGKKLALSRSQMVEIGGGFRMPEVFRAAGCKLLELGATNCAHLSDYESAIAEGAVALLLVHSSNYKIVGFAEEPSPAELVTLAHAHGLPAIFDLGSGSLYDTARYGLAHEPSVPEALANGFDLVCFSGDKLLGGPQAGIILGDPNLIARLKKHPLYRAMRADKLCLTALAVTLKLHLFGKAETEIPLWHMISKSSLTLYNEAAAWQQALGFGELIPGFSTVGGGSLPAETLPTTLLALPSELPAQSAASSAGTGACTPIQKNSAKSGAGKSKKGKSGSADRLLAALRDGPSPLIARVEDGRIVLDPRTVLPAEQNLVPALVRAACASLSKPGRPANNTL